MSKILIIPTDHIQRLCSSKEDLQFFFSRFPFEAVIELALYLENHRDFSTAVWEEIEKKLTDDEVEMLNLENVENLLEIIVEIFYDDLRSLTDEVDTIYTVITWLPDGVCLKPDDYHLKLREPINNVQNHYLASEF